MTQPHQVPPRTAGFTLLELIIVIAILAILSTAVVLTINPTELFHRSRDSQRLTDLAALSSAIGVTELDANIFDPDGPLYTGTCTGEASQRVYVSVPSDNGETAPNDLPSGWAYARVPAADAGRVDGSGWMPVDLTQNAGGSLLPTLPLDPTNTFASGHYYTYTCRRTPPFELTARLESRRYTTGGEQDEVSKDGGDDIFVYETGTALTLDPKAPVADWPLGGATSGSIPNNATAGFEDVSGNGHNGTAKNLDGVGMQWVAGLYGGAADFDGVDSTVQAGTGNDYFPMEKLSFCAWVQTPGLGPTMTLNGILSITYGLTFFINGSGHFVTRMDDGVAAPLLTISSQNLHDDAPHHLCMTFDGTARRMYTDGSERATDSPGWLGTTRWPTNQANIGVENNNFNIYRFNGVIDEVRLYDRALTAAEIKAQYDALKP